MDELLASKLITPSLGAVPGLSLAQGVRLVKIVHRTIFLTRSPTATDLNSKPMLKICAKA